MIARIWQGMTRLSNGEEYAKFLESEAIPDYKTTKGNRGYTFLKRNEDAITHFTLITFWDSIDSIKAFAGKDIDRPKYYPEDVNYLLSFEQKVQHFEVFSMSN